MSQHRLLTLTTDFGTTSPYAAAMKGVILSINPHIQIFDLSHDIPPQDTRYASYFLATAAPYFPSGTVHLVVVDPGVGTERRLVCAEMAGQLFVAPDNGCLTDVIKRLGEPRQLRELSQPRWWRPEISDTFHGRDILAPTAAYLTLNIEPEQMGSPIRELIRLPDLPLNVDANQIQGVVACVDTFGNLITNIPNRMLQKRQIVAVRVKERTIARYCRTYGLAAPGELITLSSSCGHLEIAQNRGNAARLLGVEVGEPVVVEFQD
jgi:S-adenosylmethionine hydrolase